MYKRISLEERLNRIEAGYSSSPQYTRLLADVFCRTPIIPALECYGSFAEREKLCELLRGEMLKVYLSALDFCDLPRKGVEEITFGDIALLIASHYLRYGTEKSDVVNQLLCIYFNTMEAMLMQRRNLPTRECLKACLQPVYDFLHISFVEYHEYAMRCGLDKYEDKITKYRVETGLSSSMTPSMIFDELKSEQWGYEDSVFDMTQDAGITVEKCEHLIDFFVCPVAMIWMHNFIHQ